jgi:sulfite reductase (NADPH) flavoprotein alpha-component
MSDAAPAPKSIYSKNNPFQARITANYALTKDGSEKETRHLIVNLNGSDLVYEPGYSLGIFAQNPPTLVAQICERLKLDPSHPVPQKDGSTKTLNEVLLKDVTLNRAGKKFMLALPAKLPEGAKKAEAEALAADAEKLDAYLFTRDYRDVFNDFPEYTATAEELLEVLGRSVPRLYSIASSLKKHPGEVHLTIGVVRYTTHDREKKGLASGFLADHAEMHTNSLPVFLAANKHFKLPEPDKDVIMVGPGTGIAPFRAFLEEREVTGAKGRNWLFFGEQRKATDFLYEEEFAAWKQGGLLTRLDTAFSRDQSQKVYVQDRMRENARELWAWLQGGAYFYVCGDAKRMAKDVNQTLIDIAVEHGGMALADAEKYINETLARTERRYLKDVY